MKKNFWSGRMKTILIAALVVAILAAVVLGLSSGASFFENVTGSILSPVRSAVAAIDRQFEKYYNYLFQYAKLEADNAARRARSSRWRRTSAPWRNCSAKLSDTRRCCS